MKIRGATVAERQRARAKRSTARRSQHFLGLIDAADGRPWAQMRHLGDYLTAVAKELPSDRVGDLVKDVIELMERWHTA
jgi:hypothetical protein